MKRLSTLTALGAVALLTAGPALAAEKEPAEARLTPLYLVESKDSIDFITQTDMERKTALTLWDALKGVLGVYQTTSPGRNEGTISIRGGNRYQTGLYIDGVPVATAYRNEWDANNAMLFDLESIEISKGYSSPLLASNNSLAGAVNLRTAKPSKELEFSAKYMNFFDRNLDDQGRLFTAAVGTRQENFYLKVAAALNQRDFFTLPSSFSASSFEDGGRRENSDYKNKAVNFIAGWTPTEDVDVMFGFSRQSYEKGQPFDAAQTYASPANAVSDSYPYNRFWRWPEYETSRYYLNADIGLTEAARLKAVLYHDKHTDTSINYYRNPGLNGIPPFTGVDLAQREYADKTYEQYTTGGQLALDYVFSEAHKLALSAGYRELSHKEYNDYDGLDDSLLPRCTANNQSNGVTPPNCRRNQSRKKGPQDNGRPMDEHMVEAYWDFGAEYSFKPLDFLTLVFGASHSSLIPKTIETRYRNDPTNNATPPPGAGNTADGQMYSYKDLLGGSRNLFNYQLGVFYDLTENHELFATFAKKSRFATMRERYYRNGGAPTNPDLKPEEALHYELGYRGLLNDWLKINSSLYYSDVTDMIVSQSCADASGAVSTTCFQNLGKTNLYGFELGAEALFNENFSAGLTFNYMEWENHSNDDNLTGLPMVTGSLYGVISPVKDLSIIPQINLSSGFYWKNLPNDFYSRAPGYATVDLKAVYDVNEHLSLEIGAKNIFDHEYALEAYYPEAGANFFVGLTGRY